MLMCVSLRETESLPFRGNPAAFSLHIKSKLSLILIITAHFYVTIRKKEKTMLKIKRIYEEPSKEDGTRVFVDRLWARGVKKADAHLDYWMKDIAPTPELRKWFNHESEKFEEFRKEYEKELSQNTEAVEKLRELIKKGDVTLIYAAKSPTINHALVLKEYLEKTGM